MQICCSNSLSHFECDGHTVHMLTQWCIRPPLTSTVKLALFTHVHSDPLFLAPGYIDVVQTILIILTMAGLFADRPCMHSYVHILQRIIYNKALFTIAKMWK